MSTSPNAEIVEAWDTVLFDKFVRYRHLLTLGLERHGNLALEKHAPQAGQRVIDLGCGFGDATAQIAELVGPRGEAIGVDCAPSFVKLARREHEQAGIENSTFLTADVQVDDLRGPYDAAFSRFGVMFFLSLVSALKNLKSYLRPGAQVTMVVWRKRQDNPWLYTAEQTVRDLVAENHESTEVTCGPGPFSMSGPDMVSEQLLAAGYGQIAFERQDLDICIGRNLDESVEFAMDLGPAGEIMRLAGPAAEAAEPEVRAALRVALSQYAGDEGVWAPSSTWCITARV